MSMTFSDAEIWEERTSPAIPVEMWDWEELRRIATWTAQRTYKGELVEDFVQTALEKAVEKSATIKFPKAYIKKTVTNLILDYLNSAQNTRSSVFAVPEPGDHQWQSARDILGRPISIIKPKDVAQEIASSDFFASLLHLIPENKRDLFIDYLEGVPNEELAQIYEYSSAASVRQTLMRIKNDLRAKVLATGLLKEI